MGPELSRAPSCTADLPELKARDDSTKGDSANYYKDIDDSGSGGAAQGFVRYDIIWGSWGGSVGLGAGYGKISAPNNSELGTLDGYRKLNLVRTDVGVVHRF